MFTGKKKQHTQQAKKMSFKERIENLFKRKNLLSSISKKSTEENTNQININTTVHTVLNWRVPESK